MAPGPGPPLLLQPAAAGHVVALSCWAAGLRLRPPPAHRLRAHTAGSPAAHRGASCSVPQICGESNMRVIDAVAEAGVARFSFISGAQPRGSAAAVASLQRLRCGPPHVRLRPPQLPPNPPFPALQSMTTSSRVAGMPRTFFLRATSKASATQRRTCGRSCPTVRGREAAVPGAAARSRGHAAAAAAAAVPGAVWCHTWPPRLCALPCPLRRRRGAAPRLHLRPPRGGQRHDAPGMGGPAPQGGESVLSYPLAAQRRSECRRATRAGGLLCSLPALRYMHPPRRR